MMDSTFRSLIFSSNVCVKKFLLWDPILMISWTLNRSLSRTSSGPLDINDGKLYEDKNGTDMKDIYF